MKKGIFNIKLMPDNIDLSLESSISIMPLLYLGLLEVK